MNNEKCRAARRLAVTALLLRSNKLCKAYCGLNENTRTIVKRNKKKNTHTHTCVSMFIDDVRFQRKIVATFPRAHRTLEQRRFVATFNTLMSFKIVRVYVRFVAVTTHVILFFGNKTT